MPFSDPAPTAAALHARARSWIAGDPDPVTRAALEQVLAAGDEAVLAEHVDGSLAFGTAGLRGIVGPGPLRMNRAVVIRTTRGLADHLLATVDGAAERGVVVGFDARHDSARFATDVIAVLCAAGLAVHRFVTPQPTPLVAYAQKVLGAAAAVVVTASHNPPEYNGYKVYTEGAAQLVAPEDTAIAAAIDAVGPATEVPRADPETSERVRTVTDQVVDRYLGELATTLPPVDGPELRIVTTPLHGVAGPLLHRALRAHGYHDLHEVASQAVPDGDFPTVPFPNPEEPGALDAALQLAGQLDADLVLANDPDGDRLAVAVPDGAGGHRALTGNQVGVLLADHLLRGADADHPLVVASIVSTPMFRQVAAAYRARAEWSLTGFKWICKAARDLAREQGTTLVVGFEEALGVTIGDVVHDKDGIGAGVAMADLARALAAEGHTVRDRLEQLARRHGRWVSYQHAVLRPGSRGQAEILAALEQLAAAPPTRLGEREVRGVTDYRVGAEARPAWLTTHDLVALDLDDGRAMLRPSGTEPKAKIYVDLRADHDAVRDPAAAVAALEAEARRVALELARHVGLD